MATFTGRRVRDLAVKTFTHGAPHVHDLAGVQPGRVLIVADEGEPVSFTARLWEPPTVLGGGGVEAVARPLRRPLTVYRGPEALGISLSILFDGWRGGHSVEPQCRKVEKMAGLFLPDDPGPPNLIVAGPGIPHCWGPDKALRRRWLISEPPAWGDDPPVIRGRSMRRVRQQVTLTLLLAAEVEELERLRPRQPKPETRTVRAKKGDTYRKVAARELGTARLGRRLAKLNGDRDPQKKLHEGHKVKLPSHDKLKEWKEALPHGDRS